jgi:hypothetical protein
MRPLPLLTLTAMTQRARVARPRRGSAPSRRVAAPRREPRLRQAERAAAVGHGVQ